MIFELDMSIYIGYIRCYSFTLGLRLGLVFIFTSIYWILKLYLIFFLLRYIPSCMLIIQTIVAFNYSIRYPKFNYLLYSIETNQYWCFYLCEGFANLIKKSWNFKCAYLCISHCNISLFVFTWAAHVCKQKMWRQLNFTTLRRIICVVNIFAVWRKHSSIT